jgi:hypothetical protein
MVDQKEWQEFRADWIVFLIGAGIALCALLLLGLRETINAPEFDGNVEGIASRVSCDGQLPDCAAYVPRSAR